MALNGTTISKEGLEYLCGLINKIVSSPKDLLDDINLATNTTFSSVRIDSLIADTLQQANTHAEALCNALTKLTCEKTTTQPTLSNSKKNVIYLYSSDGNAPFYQYLKISDTELIDMGSTSISLNDYLTITDAVATYCKKTDFDALKTEVDKVKNDKVNKSGDTMTGTLTIKKSGDDATLLTFDTERSWSFKQGNTGASASLDLVSSGNDKKFRILNTDKTKGLEVHTSALATSVSIDGNKVITEDQLQKYIPYFPKTIQFGHTVATTNDAKWVKIFEFTPDRYDWNGGNFIITFSSLNPINSYYPFGKYELIWRCNSRGADGITDVYLNQIISQNGDICHTRGSVLCVGISENKKTVGLYAFLGVSSYQTMLATIFSGGSRYENRQAEIAKWINIDKPTVGLEAQPTFSKANYYSLADNLGGWTYTATKLPVLNYTNVEQ